MLRLLAMATGYDQEAILYLDEMRNAFMISVSTRERTALGELVTVSREEVLSQDVYSYDESTGCYYIVR